MDQLSIFEDNINLGMKFRWAAFRFYRIIFVSYWPITSPGQIWSYKIRRCWNRRRSKRRMSKSLNLPSYEHFQINTTKNDQAMDSTSPVPHRLPSQLARFLFFITPRVGPRSIHAMCVWMSSVCPAACDSHLTRAVQQFRNTRRFIYISANSCEYYFPSHIKPYLGLLNKLKRKHRHKRS